MVNYRVLITGASGFIGTHLLQSLVRYNCDILAISRSPQTEKSEGSVIWLEADLSQPSTYEAKVEDFTPEVVIHLAWQDIPDFSFEKSINNLQQSLEFLSFVSDLGSCKKILVSGSCWEINQLNVGSPDTHRLNPMKHFTWAKNSLCSWLEMKCLEMEIQFAWFRIFYVYGPKQRDASLIPSILTNLKEGRLPQIKTPYNLSDYIFIDDVVDAFMKAVSQDFSSGIYNLGTGTSASVLEICSLSEKIVLGSNTLTKNLQRNLGPDSGHSNFSADTNKTTKILGWTSKTTLESGIKKTWQYIKA